MATEMTCNKAIRKTLEASEEPLHYKEIAQRIIGAGWRTSLGATPWDVVTSQMSTSLKNDPNSPFIRVSRGTYTLKTKLNNDANKSGQSKSVETDSDKEPQYAIISSFGMFWQREAVEWQHTTKLLGVQEVGADTVDFGGQYGIYLLYDGREVIYVGRSTDRPLGRRLYEHTSDRMVARWDRFSWFGIRPVTDSGQLQTVPTSFDAAKLIPALEAVLIEALEPRQNRKRGDDLAAAEYIQKIDPAVRDREMAAYFDEMRRR